MKRCLFPARVGILAFIVNMIKVLFPICTLTWRVNIYVSRQGKDVNRRNESTIIVNISAYFSMLTIKLTVKIVTSHLFDHIFRYFSKLIENYKIMQSSILLNTFPSRNDNIKKQVKVGSCVKGNTRMS